MPITANTAVAVFTSWSKEEILEQGASGNWGVSPDRILQNRYLVVTRNRHSDWCPDDYEHGTAFLIARISGVRETDDFTKDDRRRYAIAFDAYAEIDVRDAWGKSRNPVWFTDLETLGIDLETVDFVGVKSGENVEISKQQRASKDEGLSFLEARKGLATRYGVPTNAIEIIIRG